jgi:hypothetical protein
VLRLYGVGDRRISMEHWLNDTDRGKARKMPTDSSEEHPAPVVYSSDSVTSSHCNVSKHWPDYHRFLLHDSNFHPLEALMCISFILQERRSLKMYRFIS